MREIDQIARRLIELHKMTGDQRYLRAAEILSRPPTRAARPLVHDYPQLIRMAWLIREKHAKSEHAAACIVANEIGGHSISATKARLCRKFRKQRDHLNFITPFIGPALEFFGEGVTDAVPGQN